ncbi:response regulator transcription factor [Cohnella fermenti]|uniref:Response regulator transcription factor n=1 Tax=Cohnella fermenti TaxID=2565925 RepID=A0A4S4BIX7_9BACL|nr:response regulator transcription factor [Cohnella fermenti]THF74359.1 response regulator transcription factor [Cohnella fermenti]
MDRCIRVFLIEDDPIWQEGIVGMLGEQPDMEICGMASNRQEALERINAAQPDVILLDVILTPPHYDGLDVAIELLAMRPTKLIMLTAVDEPEVIGDVFAAGVVDYVAKSYAEDLPEAVRNAFVQRASLHPHAMEQLRKEMSRLKHVEWQQKLTPTEQQMLKWLEAGYSRRQVMKQLNISQNTVKSHIRHIVKKIGGANGKEAAEIARQKQKFHG